MTNPKDPNSPPIPVPETMEEFREMARTAMALAAKTAVNLDKLEKRLDQVAERLDEVGKRLDEVGKRVDEVCAQVDKMCERVDKIAKLSGNNDRNTGRLLEEEIIAQVDRDGKIAWMRVDKIHPHLTSRVKRRVVGEYDLVIVNGTEVMVVEIKRVLRADEVRNFAEIDLAQFPRRFPEIAGKRAIYGAVAFALEEDGKDARAQAQKAAEEAGVLLIRAVGETGLEFLNPDREKLRAVRA